MYLHRTNFKAVVGKMTLFYKNFGNSVGQFQIDF